MFPQKHTYYVSHLAVRACMHVKPWEYLMSPEASIWVSTATAELSKAMIGHTKPERPVCVFLCKCINMCVCSRQVGGGLGPDEVLAGVTTQVLPYFHGHHFTHKYPGYLRQRWELRTERWGPKQAKSRHTLAFWSEFTANCKTGPLYITTSTQPKLFSLILIKAKKGVKACKFV